MTRDRMFGSDSEFCAWLRACKDLPSFSRDVGIVATDSDVIIHRYKSCVDSIGTRELQGLMHLEVKTRCGEPSPSQMDTLSKMNLFKGDKRVGGQTIRNLGVFVLILSGVSPYDSKLMWWCSMPADRCIGDAKLLHRNVVNCSQLIKLLKFDLHPVTLQPVPFRRHHATKEILVRETAPLGFQIDRRILRRS